MSARAFPLGRLEPSDFEHLSLYPMRAVMAETTVRVERVLDLPLWHWTHDQGKEGSCVGHGIALERAITNRLELVAENVADDPPLRYDPIDVWNQAKIIDEWPDSKPGDNNGTSVRAGYQVTKTRGLCRVRTMRLIAGVPTPRGECAPDPSSGVAAYRWAQSVDEVRSAIAAGLPVTLGVNWYSGFDKPAKRADRAYWLVDTSREKLGSIRGGHCICAFGASDRRHAVRLHNSWGKAYPLVWLPYTTLDRLIREHGEAALVTDR